MKKFKVALVNPLNGQTTLLAHSAKEALDLVHEMTGCKVKLMEVIPLCRCSAREQLIARMTDSLDLGHVVLERDNWQPAKLTDLEILQDWHKRDRDYS